MACSYMNNDDFACTLDECALELGVSRSMAYQLQKSALAKLRRHPAVLRHMAAMAAELEKNRPGPAERDAR